MRKSVSLSALLTSLLAGPAFAGPPAPQVQPDAPLEQRIVVSDPQAPEWRQAFPGEMPAQLREQVQMLLDGRSPMDVNGMQEMRRQMAQQMNEHLQRVLAQATAPATGNAPGVPMGPQIIQRGSTQILVGPGMPGVPQIQIIGDTVVLVGTQTEKAAFLGVTTSVVAGPLREQLKLQRGFGLLIDFIEPDSPAAKAGLKLFDVVLKVDDQMLVNPQQLAVLVRAKKPADTITLSVIRGGEAVTLTAKLIEKELPVLETPALPGAGGAGAPAMPPNVDNPPAADGTVKFSRTDGEHAITISIVGKGKMLNIKDVKTGKTIFEGPANTDEDLKTLPANIVDKVKSLNAKVTVGK